MGASRVYTRPTIRFSRHSNAQSNHQRGIGREGIDRGRTADDLVRGRKLAEREQALAVRGVAQPQEGDTPTPYGLVFGDLLAVQRLHRRRRRLD